MNKYLKVGATGCLLWCPFLLFVFYRVVYSLAKYGWHGNFRQCFFITVSLNAVAESIYFANMAVERDITDLGFSFHLVGIFLNLLAVSLVVLLWSKAIMSKRVYAYMFFFVSACLLLNLAVSVTCILLIGLFFLQQLNLIAFAVLVTCARYVLGLLITLSLASLYWYIRPLVIHLRRGSRS